MRLTHKAPLMPLRSNSQARVEQRFLHQIPLDSRALIIAEDQKKGEKTTSI